MAAKSLLGKPSEFICPTGPAASSAVGHRQRSLLLLSSPLRTADREVMGLFFTLLAERHERCSVLLTSNLPFSKWDQIFKDTMTTAEAIDRLVHHSVIIGFKRPMTDHRTKRAQLQNRNCSHRQIDEINIST